MSSFPFSGPGAFENTRMGEIFEGLDARAGNPTTREADKDTAQMLVAGTFLLEYITGVIALAKLKDAPISSALSAGFDRYIQFIALIRPDWFITPEQAEKTRKTFLVAYSDIRDAILKG